MLRREFLSAVALAPALRPAALWASRIIRSSDPRIEEFDFTTLGSSITPEEDFYIRDHFAAPRLVSPSWRLHIGGHVRSSLELTYADILRGPARNMVATLECAGNAVGAGGVSTAEWTGIPLRKLLERAGLRPEVKQIRLIGTDGNQGQGFFLRSIPVEKAIHPHTLLAFQMNGAQLPAEHGYPLRAIVPGWYAMDSVKWLARIEALDHEDASPFMTQEYVAVRLQAVGSERTPVTRMQVKSQIAWPPDGMVLGCGRHTIRGAAWAGENRVALVEVSTNAGQDWAAASLEKSPAPYAWVLWNYPWEAQRPSEYRVSVRATDDKGNTQPASRDPLRVDAYELNWRQSVRCTVKQRA
jgi:DMSO/TMAO reductase YedYZ molybdopterin-dependent catalytic subunit